MSKIKKSAVRTFALRASTELKNGKFTRVSPQFVSDIEAEMERIIRGIAGVEISDRPLADPPRFVTPAALKSVRENLDLCIARVIQRKVQGMPSLGKTL